MADPVHRAVIEDIESAPPAAVSATGTHVMALAAGAVALVALVASIASGSTIIPIASFGEGDRTNATVTPTPVPSPPPATPLFATSGPRQVVISAAPSGGMYVLVPQSLPARTVRLIPCDEPSRSPMEVVYRMFDLTISGPSAFSECWTPGRAPKEPVLTSYMRARSPSSLTTENVVMHFANGQLSATVTVRAWWEREPPMGWANGESRWILMRQQPDGSWNIDAVAEKAP